MQSTAKDLKRVLIVEDHPDTRDVFRTILEFRGYTVTEAADGDEGLEAIRSELPDLVVLDLGLPRIDGWEVAQAAKADPRTASVPILIVSAYADIDGKRKADSLGCEDLLRKPLNPMVFLRAVEKLIGSPGGVATDESAIDEPATDEPDTDDPDIDEPATDAPDASELENGDGPPR